MAENPTLDTQAKVAARASRKSGRRVAQTTVSILLNPDHPVSPKLDTIEAVATAFGRSGWELLHPTCGDMSEAADILRHLADASERERNAVFHLLAMEPLTDYQVEQRFKRTRRKSSG